MVAFLIQPVSGECCADPCSRSGPCDPCGSLYVCVLTGGTGWEGRYTKFDFHNWYNDNDPAYYLYWETPANWWSFRHTGGGAFNYASVGGDLNDPSAGSPYGSPITSVILNGGAC